MLAGVVGRPAASLPNFGYTRALSDSHLIWSEAELDRFLTSPQALVPGSAMVVAVASPQDRRDLIAYLASLPAIAVPGRPTLDRSVALSAGDWQNDKPGLRHFITVADLPRPFATESAGNSPSVVDLPPGAHLSVPAGFEVRAYASGLEAPRRLLVAPNGDLFIAEQAAGIIRVLRSAPGVDHPQEDHIFAGGLQGPFGMAFYPLGAHPRWLYVGLLNQLIRFPYRAGDMVARGSPDTILPELAPRASGGHTTRDLAFSRDGRRLFIAVGSGSNVAEEMPLKSPDEIRAWEADRGLGAAWGPEENRANILVTDPEGRTGLRRYATGIRNAVGLAVDPWTGVLWCSVNERDALGDNLVPDYITRVSQDHFYGWPWYYLGDHEDPRHAHERPDLVGHVTIPDVLLQSHSASLQLAFYTARSGVAAFPPQYYGDIFAAEHGSWNRAVRTGSKVIRIHLRNGVPTGEYEDFMTGFIVDNTHVWGRPVGVAVAQDGALFVSDDAGGVVWRIAYKR